MSLKIYLIGLGVVTLGYALYVQFSEGMGNIWIRKNSDNQNKFCPSNLINLMVAPFQTCGFWKPSMWSINYPLIIAGYSGSYYYCTSTNFNVC